MPPALARLWPCLSSKASKPHNRKDMVMGCGEGMPLPAVKEGAIGGNHRVPPESMDEYRGISFIFIIMPLFDMMTCEAAADVLAPAAFRVPIFIRLLSVYYRTIHLELRRPAAKIRRGGDDIRLTISVNIWIGG